MTFDKYVSIRLGDLRTHASKLVSLLEEQDILPIMLTDNVNTAYGDLVLKLLGEADKISEKKKRAGYLLSAVICVFAGVLIGIFGVSALCFSLFLWLICIIIIIVYSNHYDREEVYKRLCKVPENVALIEAAEAEDARESEIEHEKERKRLAEVESELPQYAQLRALLQEQVDRARRNDMPLLSDDDVKVMGDFVSTLRRPEVGDCDDRSLLVTFFDRAYEILEKKKKEMQEDIHSISETLSEILGRK